MARGNDRSSFPLRQLWGVLSRGGGGGGFGGRGVVPHGCRGPLREVGLEGIGCAAKSQDRVVVLFFPEYLVAAHMLYSNL